jgi:hypothetical protein
MREERKRVNRETGSHLQAPVTEKDPSPLGLRVGVVSALEWPESKDLLAKVAN